MSTTPEELTGFVKAALAKGRPRTEIGPVLQQAGWTRSQIGEALGYSLLSGELTTRVVLKVLVVAVIAGTVFWYYLTDVRREA